MAPILVTGANGHLGRRFIKTLPAERAVEALVRSQRAHDVLLSHTGDRQRLNVTIADPGDPAAVAEVAARCEQAVHLIGMIKETRDNRYRDAHERPALALSKAAPQTALTHIVYVSILGSDPNSPSRCLRARAAVEEILMAGRPSVSVIRVPMVLGERDRASFALAKRAAAARVVLFRAGSREQPIYAGDVVAAITHATAFAAPDDHIFDLAGPESISRRELIERAASVLDNRPSIYSLPLSMGLGLAGLLEWTTHHPPMTRELLRVLDHDDAIDPSGAAEALGIKLTPLDTMLRR
ncbi:MAG: NAD(P)H-binding protein [Gammaproteobacteria bacterium]|nr:NAD(P)H-binding protein [Gammaproteobacteria bacterium]